MAVYLQVRPDVSLEEQIQSLKNQVEMYLNSDTSAELAQKASKEALEAAAASKDVERRANAGEFDASVLRIDSSRGITFKNNAISTVLSVVIHTGGLIITNVNELHDRYGVTAHLLWYWQQEGEEDYHVISSSDPMLSESGFKLTLTPNDVDGKATFICELIV